jgi:ATP-dependent exoDNAse (exonuclease V) beta subunit
MDKRVVFAVAGSGKTSHIINNLNVDSRALILTYTDKNLANLKQRVLKKFGQIPSGIKIYSYFQFVYSFCVRPLLGNELKTKGINWQVPPTFTMRLKRDNIKFYIDNNKRLYSNRIAKLLEQADVIGEVVERLEKYFDHLYIDEIQDFGGHDFNLLTQIAVADINQLFVGDFYQHTFDTSRDGNVNGSLHNDYIKYKTRFEKAGITVDETLLSHSYRCSDNVCSFVTQSLLIDISSHREDVTNVEFVECETHAEKLFECAETVKLFYQSSNKYQGFTENWGATKGEDCYHDVCVVLNPNTLKHFNNGNLLELAAQTKNKLYVACTRAKNNLYFVPEKLLKKYKA